MLFKIQDSKFTFFGSLFTGLLLFTIHCSLFTALSGCGSSVTGTNTALDVSHKNGPDCTQSGCHPGFGAGGTVFTNESGVPVSGVMVKATNLSNLENTTLGTTDSLGNFHYESPLSGSFQMTVGSTQSGIYQHQLPNDRGCNSCHKWPNPGGGAMGRLY